MDWKRIIVAIDDSPRSINAVEYVGSLVGGRDDVFLCLLHIYPEPPPDYYRSGASLDEYKKKQDEQASTLFDRAATILARHGVPPASLTSRCLMADRKSISAAILDMRRADDHRLAAALLQAGQRGLVAHAFGQAQDILNRALRVGVG